MKKLKKYLLLLTALLYLSGCGDVKQIDGVTYDVYGLFNETDKKNNSIEYELVVGNVVWSVILIETIVAPIYFLGFSLYEPVGEKDANHIVGEVKP